MCSSPANWFHLLRRQGLSPVRRPLIAFTPKSLLRLKAATSELDEFTGETGFQPVIGDSADPAGVTRVLLCSGKVYYDLVAKRAQDDRKDVAIVRVEQLYPLPADELNAELAKYPNAQLVWVQEEPANQGPWPFIALNLPEHLGGRPLLRASRAASASPAVGSHEVHEAQQREVVATAFRGIEELAERRAGEQVDLEWLASRLQAFVDEHPEFETAVDRLATWLARDDADGD
jgi:2-oxoglutarate dehydrogenase complex dehydrogenase (E1) component-like enzyme